MLGGNYTNRFSIQGRSYKVIPQVDRKYRLNPGQLGSFPVRTASNNLVPLSALVTLEDSVQPRELKRFQQQNSITLSAVPAPGVTLGAALNYLRDTATRLSPPQRAAIALDYGMSDGRLTIHVRKAMLYYALKRLGLDTDPSARRPQDQQIVLLGRGTVLPERNLPKSGC